MKGRTASLVIFAVFLCLTSGSSCGQNLPSACGDSAAEYKVTYEHPTSASPQPAAPDHAKLYIIEVDNVADTGRVNRPLLRHGIDGKWRGATQGFSYISEDVSPGVHHLCSQWQSRSRSLALQVSLNEVDAKSGRNYYFRAQIQYGGTGGYSIDLQPVSQDEGEFLVSQAARALSTRK